MTVAEDHVYRSYKTKEEIFNKEKIIFFRTGETKIDIWTWHNDKSTFQTGKFNISTWLKLRINYDGTCASCLHKFMCRWMPACYTAVYRYFAHIQSVGMSIGMYLYSIIRESYKLPSYSHLGQVNSMIPTKATGLINLADDWCIVD